MACSSSDFRKPDCIHTERTDAESPIWVAVHGLPRCETNEVGQAMAARQQAAGSQSGQSVIAKTDRRTVIALLKALGKQMALRLLRSAAPG